MNLKRVLSFGAATALAVCLSVPVFAEEDSATPGQMIEAVTKDPTASVQVVGDAVAAMTKEYCIAANKDESVEIPAVVTDQALRYFDMAEEQLAETGSSDLIARGSNENGDWRCDKGAEVSIENKLYDATSGEMKVTAFASRGDSKHGYSITVELDPSVTCKEFTVADENGKVKCDRSAKVQEIVTKEGTKKIATFWVPHFTTYVLTPVTNSTAATTTTPSATAAPKEDNSIQYYTCPACGYHNWTATEEGYRCDNCGYIESQTQLAGYGNVKGVYSPKTGTENPIKATGADMNRTVFVVVALAVAAACGIGYMAKKSGKTE